MNRILAKSSSGSAMFLTAVAVSISVALSLTFFAPLDSAVAASTVLVRAAGRGNPWLNLQDSREMRSRYSGTQAARVALEGGSVRARSLSSADFDLDGTQDLVAGYRTDSGGILTLHRGNLAAFSPAKRTVLKQIRKNRFPEPFFEEAAAFELPSAPDFLATGDFNRDGEADVIAAARGSNQLLLLSGDGRGGLAAPVTLELSGAITSLVAGDVNQQDGATDLVIGISGDSGAELLVYQTEAGTSLFAGEPARYTLTAEATSIVLGRLDDDAPIDVAALTGGEVVILNGRSKFSSSVTDESPVQLERVSVPFQVTGLAIGDFIRDRAFRTELAAMSADGTVSILSRGQPDMRRLTAENVLELRRGRAAERVDAMRGTPSLTKPANRIKWVVAETSVLSSTHSAGNLMGARLASRQAEDVLVMSADARQMQILISPEDGISASRSLVSLEAEEELAAALPLRLNVDGRPGVVVLSSKRTAPSLIMPQAAEVITVDTTNDTVAVNPAVSALDANGNISLRSAIQRSNANVGTDTILFSASLNGTPITLTLTGNDNSSSVGDLDINDSVNIIGNGAAQTIVQAGTNDTNGIDKVFGIDQNGVSGIAASISDIAIRFGRNSVVPVGDFTETGGGLDFFNFGTNTLAMTNCVITDNSVLNSYGGGINIDGAAGGGPVTITGCTISNNRTLSNAVVAPGGGVNLFGDTHNVTFTNCDISGNQVVGRWEGGGVHARHSFGGSIQLHNCQISNNTSGSRGGGIGVSGFGVQAVTVDQKSVISGNVSGTNATGVAEGGGVYVAQVDTASTFLSKVTVTGNSLSPNAATQVGGGGIAVGDIGTPVLPNVTIEYSRVVGNTATSGPGFKKVGLGTVKAENNWWGCNTDPSSAPCNAISITAPGVVDFTPWLTLTHTANPTTICVGQQSTLTASFLVDSNGGAVSASNLDVLVGVPVTFNNAVFGTISNAQTAIQANGTATATFTATATGSGGADATVDSVTVTAPITIEAGADATITPNPAQVCANSTGNQASAAAGAASYVWAITNGTITNGQGTPTITYTAGASGNVTLDLTVTSSSGCTDQDSIQVPINPSPDATITPNPASVCPNSTGNQASAPAGAASYGWTIANGTITSAANIQTITYTAGSSGNVTLSVTVTNSFGCSAEDSIDVPISGSGLSSLGPANVWVGLKTSDDVGTKFDFLAEVFMNGVLVGSGQLNDVPGGSSGFNNAVLSTIPLTQSGSGGCGGDTLSFKLSVRVAASSGHTSGTARLWFNDSAANSRFAATIGSPAEYFLRSGFLLELTAGPGPKDKIDVLVQRSGGNPWKPFGTWTRTL